MNQRVNDDVLKIGGGEMDLTLDDIKELKRLANLSRSGKVVYSFIIGAGVIISPAIVFFDIIKTKLGL